MLAANALLVLASFSAVEAPQLYHFTSKSCPACRQVEPTVAQLKAQGVPVVHVDADRRREWAQQARVHALPTFIVVANGQEVGRLVGAANFQDLSQLYLKATKQMVAAAQPPADLQRRRSSPDSKSIPSDRIRPSGFVAQNVAGDVRDENLIRGQDPRPTGPTERLNRALSSLNVRGGVNNCSLCSGVCQCSQGESNALSSILQPMSSGQPSKTPTNLPVKHEDSVEEPTPTCLEGALAATVRLRVVDELGQSYGTGTIIDVHNDESLVLTCGHIFRDSEGKGRVFCDSFAPGAEPGVEGRLISYDIRRDVGLVSFRPGVSIKPAVVCGTGHRPRDNDQVFSIGCNHGADPTVVVNRIIAVNRYHGPPNVVVGGRPVDGRSGGGLFAANGTLIGVCNAADPEYDEGLYAAIGNVHAELDSVGLGFIYRQQQPEVALGDTRLPNRPRSTRRDNESANGESSVRREQSRSTASPPTDSNGNTGHDPTADPQLRVGSNSEAQNTPHLVATIRPPGNPRASVELFIERPSPELLEQLSREANSRGPHRQTQLQIRNEKPVNKGAWHSLDPRTAAM